MADERGLIRYVDGHVALESTGKLRLTRSGITYVTKPPPPKGFVRNVSGTVATEHSGSLKLTRSGVTYVTRLPKRLPTNTTIKERLLASFNEANRLNLQQDEVVFGTPVERAARSSNTDVMLTCLPNSRYRGEVTVSYQRVSIGLAFDYNDPFFTSLEVTDGTPVRDYIEQINTHFGYYLSPDDVEDDVVQNGELRFRAHPESLLLCTDSRSISSLFVTDQLDGFDQPTLPDMSELFTSSQLDGFDEPVQPTIAGLFTTDQMDGFTQS